MKLASIFFAASANILAIYLRDTNKRARNMKLASIIFAASANILAIYFRDTNKRAYINKKGTQYVASPECKVSYQLLDYTEFLTYLGEGCNSLVEVLTAMSGRELHTDTSLILRYYGIVETCYVDTLLGHTVCEVL